MTWRDLYCLGILLPIAGGDGGTEGTIGVDEPTTIDKRVDTRTRTHTQPVSGLVVHREIIGIGDPTTDARIADVTNADPAAGDDGLVVRNIPSGTQAVSGTVNIGTFPDNEPFNLAQLNGVALASPFDLDTGAGTQNIAGVSLRKAASGGSVELGTSTDPVRVDPTGTTTQPVSGTVTANQGTAGATGWEVVGEVAHDAAAAGNPVSIGALAETPDDTAPGNQVSAEADAVRIAADRDGAVYTHPHPPRIWHASNEYTTAQTDATVKAAPGVGLSLYITNIYLACNAAVTVTLEEGTTTLKWRYYAGGQGDGASVPLIVPIKLTANTALTVTTSGAVTVTLVVSGYTAP